MMGQECFLYMLSGKSSGSYFYNNNIILLIYTLHHVSFPFAVGFGVFCVLDSSLGSASFKSYMTTSATAIPHIHHNQYIPRYA